MRTSRSARWCTRPGWTGCRRRWPGWSVACSTGSATRWRAPHRSCATRRGRTSRRTPTAAARSSWCWRASSRTSTATFRPAAISVTRRPRRIRRVRRQGARSSSSSGNSIRRIGHRCGSIPAALAFGPVAGRPGVEAMPLFQDRRETVRLERWPPGGEVELARAGGIEVLVLDGGFSEGGESFEPQSWLRLPCGAGCGPRPGRRVPGVGQGGASGAPAAGAAGSWAACESCRVDIDSPQTRH